MQLALGPTSAGAPYPRDAPFLLVIVNLVQQQEVFRITSDSKPYVPKP